MDKIKESTLSEAMTAKEVLFKKGIQQCLREEGFNTFAKYMDNFHVNFCTSEQAQHPFVAAVDLNGGTIYVNPVIPPESVSVVVRHEMGHVIFKHGEHLFAKLKAMGIDTPSKLAYELCNYAGDYEISNEIYDDADMRMMKYGLRIENGEEFPALVTEFDFPENPEYWTMNFDQLWDVFVKNFDRDALTEKYHEVSEEFAKGWNQAMDDFDSGKITAEDIEKYLQENPFCESLDNPFTGGDAADGYQEGIKALARYFKNAGKGKGPGGQTPPRDPKLKNPKKLPKRPGEKQQGEKQPGEKQQGEKQLGSEDGQEQENGNKNPSEKGSALTPDEIKDLAKRIKQARDKAEDVIDDAGNYVGDQNDKKDSEDAAQKVDQELDELEKAAKEAKTKEDQEKINARLTAITTFWDNANTEEAKKELRDRKEFNDLIKRQRIARAEEEKRKRQPKVLNIQAIVDNIVNTLKSEPRKEIKRSYQAYNPHNRRRGFIAKGKQKVDREELPSVVFYFDVSGSWNKNPPKLEAGKKIRDALKKLDEDGIIKLTNLYFGTEVHTEFTTADVGNSDEPIPDAAGLAQNHLLDNVIIMTDTDPSGIVDTVNIPGFAWLLFYDEANDSERGVNMEIINAVKAKKGKKIILIEHD